MSLVVPSRRGFLLGLSAALAAPSIVKAESLMKLLVPKQELLVGMDFGLADETAVFIRRGNELLTIERITREAVVLWANSNLFLSDFETLQIRRESFRS